MTLLRLVVTVAVLLAGAACSAAADPEGRSVAGATQESTETSEPAEDHGGAPQKSSVHKREEAVRGSVRLPRGRATRPLRWVGVRQRGRRLHVVAHRDEETRRLASRGTTLGSESEGSLTATDVAVRRRLNAVFVGICCEPVSGNIQATSLRTRQPLVDAGQGLRVDVGGARSLSVSSDAAGTVLVGHARKSDAVEFRRGWADDLAGVIDVASDPEGGRVAALIDAKKIEASTGGGPQPDDVPGVRLYTRAGGTLDDEFIKLPRRYCWVAFLAADQVALVPGATHRNSLLECGGDHVDVLDLRTGEVHERVVELAADAKTPSVDASGRYLIYTTRAGAVHWRTLDGKGGRLARRGYLAADW